METFCRRYLLTLAKQFAKAEDISLNAVSRRMHGAAHFLDEFESGKISVTLRKYDEMVRKFKRRWPDRLAWPEPKGTFGRKRNSR